MKVFQNTRLVTDRCACLGSRL